jgi:hypothetical protein
MKVTLISSSENMSHFSNWWDLFAVPLQAQYALLIKRASHNKSKSIFQIAGITSPIRTVSTMPTGIMVAAGAGSFTFDWEAPEIDLQKGHQTEEAVFTILPFAEADIVTLETNT